MAAHYSERSRLAAKAEATLIRHETLTILTCQDTDELKANVREAHARVRTASKLELRGLLKEIQAGHLRATAYCGYVGGPEMLDSISDFVRGSKDDRVPSLSLFELTKLFTKYDTVLTNLDEIPLHTFVQFHSHGMKDGRTTIELFRVDAAIHENMCSIFNSITDNYDFKPSYDIPKRRVKEQRALTQACIVGALQFVEAYLNGIAFDHVAMNGDTLDEAELSQLTEWNPDKKRRRSLSLREKLLTYPRIVAGLDRAPIQENNCKEFKYLLQEAKSARDAIVHASPSPDLLALGESKLPAFFASSVEHAKDAVDSAIIVVRRIQRSLGEFAKPMPWLLDRDAHGRFPEQVFE
ncbi:MAG: hypothetical protein RIE77_02255 [Phycisphaerales bacterium]|jgi:hypothetical protein